MFLENSNCLVRKIGKNIILFGFMATLAIIALSQTSCSVFSIETDYDPYRNKKVASLIKELSKDTGYSEKELIKIFRKVKKSEAVLKLMSKPTEKRLTWEAYRDALVSKARIDKGIDFYRDNYAVLRDAELVYGVDASIITAILGIETFYGKNRGNHKILNSLVTLVLDHPPRSKFFKSQLKAFLQLTAKERLDPSLPLGSYAGAMGVPQFIPTTYQQYSIDFDGDGLKDIWTSTADIVGSVAYYLSKHGYDMEKQIAIKAKITDATLVDNIKGFRENVFDLQEYGEVVKQGFDALTDAKLDEKVGVIPMALSMKQGEDYYLGFKNFKAITHYNRSRLYAMAVTQLAQAIEAGAQATEDN